MGQVSTCGPQSRGWSGIFVPAWREVDGFVSDWRFIVSSFEKRKAARSRGLPLLQPLSSLRLRPDEPERPEELLPERLEPDRLREPPSSSSLRPRALMPGLLPCGPPLREFPDEELPVK
jgi:hypothetical protein